MKKVVILGVTGSIGTQALSCLADCELVGVSFNKNCDKMRAILAQFPSLEVFSPSNSGLNTVFSYDELLDKTQPDLVLNCVVGFDGVYLSKLVIEKDVDLALANKESLVVGGKLLMDLLKAHPQVALYPVDSEHSSLYQLNAIDPMRVQKIYITCSGGPFYHLSVEEKAQKTFAEAIKHPNWSMGYKISIDSATLINKCFEIIEAGYLFPNKEITALYHPQSVVHSLIEFQDNSVFANMSTPDMKIAIDLALHQFRKQAPKIQSLSFNHLNLTFAEIDPNQWLPISWAYEVVAQKNHTLGIIINTVNDFTIELFKNAQIGFNDITAIIQEYIQKYRNIVVNTWSDLDNLHNQILQELKSTYFQ